MGDSRAHFRIHEVRVLPRPDEGYVKELLHRLARQVQPIMRRREWQVGRAVCCAVRVACACALALPLANLPKAPPPTPAPPLHVTPGAPPHRVLPPQP
jgi:hypothetical protein